MIQETKEVFNLIDEEFERQEDEICLIASENYMSKDVLKANGSVFVNKYSEGYSGKRYYGGCSVVDELETLAIERAKKLFNCDYANVQPNSGCQANQAVYMAILKPNDTILAMSIDDGGHISHSLGIGFAGTFYNVKTYGINDDGFLDYDELKEKIYKYKPRLLIVGASAYPRVIDFKKIREIVDEYNQKIFGCYMRQAVDNASVNNNNEMSINVDFNGYEATECYMMVDMAHIAGLVATGHHPSPFPYADVVTSTVQKTLRSGRGGLILTDDEDLAKRINSAIFPRLQGGPLQNMIAGKAVGFGEALQPEFKEYIDQVLKNIKAMEEVFRKHDIKMVSGGSDNHLILLDLRNENVTGQYVEDVLSGMGIVVNKNAVHNDPRSKTITSGIRIGTAAMTTRGMKEKEAKELAEIISRVIYENRPNVMLDTDWSLNVYETQIKPMCKKYPIYVTENIEENTKKQEEQISNISYCQPICKWENNNQPYAVDAIVTFDMD